MTCCTPTPASSGRRWSKGLVEPKLDVKNVPNLADVYPYAVSDKIVGVCAFTSAIGFGYRTDKGLPAPKSWKDLADPKYAGARGSYIIPVNSLGQMHLMMLGKMYGKGMTDLDAAYKALEQLKPIKMYDFTGGMEKALLSAEVNIGVLHDSGIYRYDGQNQPIEFAAPSEGVLSLEQVWTVTPGSKVQELAYAYVDFILRPDVQKPLCRGGVVLARQQEGEARRQIRRQALQHRGEGRAADPGRLEMVQRAQGRHRRARHAHPARVRPHSRIRVPMSESPARRPPTFVSNASRRASTARHAWSIAST